MLILSRLGGSRVRFYMMSWSITRRQGSWREVGCACTHKGASKSLSWTAQLSIVRIITHITINAVSTHSRIFLRETNVKIGNLVILWKHYTSQNALRSCSSVVITDLIGWSMTLSYNQWGDLYFLIVPPKAYQYNRPQLGGIECRTFLFLLPHSKVWLRTFWPHRTAILSKTIRLPRPLVSGAQCKFDAMDLLATIANLSRSRVLFKTSIWLTSLVREM